MGLGFGQGVGSYFLGRSIFFDVEIQWAGYLCQIMAADMEIDGGRSGRLMPQKQLDMVKAGSGLNQMGREAVPEGMDTGRLFDPGLFLSSAEDLMY